MKRNQRITKKSALGLLGLSLIIVTVSSAQAAWIPLTGAPIPVSSLPVGGLVVGDKLFAEFEVTGISDGGALQPSSATVFVQGGQDDATGDYGLMFRLSWSAGTAQLINAGINFKVSIIPGYDPRSMEAATLWLSTRGATGTGLVQACEIIYDADFLGNPLLALAASTEESDSGTFLLDSGDFMLQGNPTELKEIWVRTSITVQGGTNGTAGLDEVFMLFSQIPDEPPEPEFRRGDASGDGFVTICDACLILNWLFVGGPSPQCLDAADSDDDGAINITDAISTLNWLFLGGPPMPPPGPFVCGPDPTPDSLTCDSYTTCNSPVPPPVYPGCELSIQGPTMIEGDPGGTVQFEVTVMLTNDAPVGAWSFGIQGNYLHTWNVVAATVGGTGAEGADFDSTSVVPGGVVNGTVLDLLGTTVLDPGEDTVLKITLEVTVPDGGCEGLTLQFVDGLSGPGQPVPNLVVTDSGCIVPILNAGQIEICAVSPIQDVSIDIYPNRTPNRVFLSRNYTLYVAVLGSGDFDVTTVNSSTVKFGKTGAEASPVRAPILRDLNGDGLIDAMYGFMTFDCGFALGDTEGVLTGLTTGGTSIEGTDSVMVLP